MKLHHGNIIQIVWIITGATIQIFFITGFKGLLIMLTGIGITHFYANYVSNKQYEKATSPNSRKITDKKPMTR